MNINDALLETDQTTPSKPPEYPKDGIGHEEDQEDDSQIVDNNQSVRLRKINFRHNPGISSF